MRLRNHLHAAATASVLLSSLGFHAYAGLGLDFLSAAPVLGSSVWNLGWSFTANAPATVYGLGNWAGGGAFPHDQQVGLWDGSGTLLASAFVSNSDPLAGSASWRFAPIAPVVLTVGETYVVGGQGGADYTGEISVTVDPAITYNRDLYFYLGGPQNSPLVKPLASDFFTSPVEAAWFGGNIALSPLTTVPEPTSLALLGAGLAGLGLMHRRKRGRFGSDPVAPWD